VICAVAAPLAGCGRRGPLEAPPGTPDSLSSQTGLADPFGLPHSVGDLPDTNVQGVIATPDATKPATPGAKPARPFLLDPIL
jgi:predicted small lipoprotein YifL